MSEEYLICFFIYFEVCWKIFQNGKLKFKPYLEIQSFWNEIYIQDIRNIRSEVGMDFINNFRNFLDIYGALSAVYATKHRNIYIILGR
ncbi:hypothetical protein EO95_05275 [Methanosarcina sp. 1.H.T.1A.1]|uniref:hypothetical protein n=1 Tax=Methanosarcina sp. 1.H.T.1A.1 TaxID=1483602 RepID=UPI000620FC5D|nr:hypothetical protein [Methanosarcina sp. 1.H.T.1A.1]KKH92649.1 hypothetical protein EO95_05275 [Methanosarcina sp. 1.H.T.1A.1]